jgi:hypothetical protein
MNLEKLASYDLENEDGKLMNEKIRRARFKFLEFFSKGYNIVVHIDGSPARTDVFRKFTKRLILMDNRTKWNN